MDLQYVGIFQTVLYAMVLTHGCTQPCSVAMHQISCLCLFDVGLWGAFAPKWHHHCPRQHSVGWRLAVDTAWFQGRHTTLSLARACQALFPPKHLGLFKT
jgi:hypothetical protein